MNEGQLSFLVLGAGRSGTSLLAAMLDAHTRLAVGPELFRPGVLEGQSEEWRSKSRTERLAGFWRACDQEATRRTDVEQWANKVTLEPLWTVLPRPATSEAELAAQLLAVLPPVPIVGIIRDGRSVVASKMARAGVPLERACAQSRRSVEFADALSSRRSPAVVVRFEDLVTNPAQTLGSVCRLFGVEFEAAMGDATHSTVLLPEYRRDGLDTDRARPVDPPDGCLDLIGDHLVRSGYLAAAGPT